jgi:hypothetical protein
MAGTQGIGMLSQINVPLPQRFRVGIAVKKPIIFTLDYESQKTPITIRYQQPNATYTNLILSNIQFLRGGLETQIFALPLWLRMGLTAMFKPGIEGADASIQSNINSAFKYKMLPTKLDLGLSTKLWGAETGGTFGISAMPFFSIVQMDTLNPDFSRLGYGSIYVKKDAWQVAYQSILDAGSTLAAYSIATDKNNWMSLAKWISTLTISVRF